MVAHLQLAAYRIVQESLSNAAKHARPARTDIRITHAGGVFTVEIIDDSPNAAPAAGTGPGLARARPLPPPARHRMSSILLKLGLHRRVQAVILA